MAEVDDGGMIEVWGNGTAVRSYTYVEDMVDGIYRLVQSDLTGPTNIGSSEYVTVSSWRPWPTRRARPSTSSKYVDGPVGVQSRNFIHARIEGLGWKAEHGLRDGIEKTYTWIAAQVAAKRAPVSS